MAGNKWPEQRERSSDPFCVTLAAPICPTISEPLGTLGRKGQKGAVCGQGAAEIKSLSP